MNYIVVVVGFSDSTDTYRHEEMKFIVAVRNMKKRFDISDTIKCIKRKDISKFVKIA